MTINPVAGSHRFEKTQINYMFFVWYSSGAIFSEQAQWRPLPSVVEWVLVGFFRRHCAPRILASLMPYQTPQRLTFRSYRVFDFLRLKGFETRAYRTCFL